MFLQRDEGSLAFDDTGGDGRPVLCLPGLGDVRAEYRRLTPFLAESGLRVITADLRGHGESSVGWAGYAPEDVGSDAVALLDALDLNGAVLVGTSMAAAAMVWAAAERPQRVAGLVLIGPFVRDFAPTLGQRLAMALLLRGPWRVAAWVRMLATLYPLRLPPDWPDYARHLAAALARPGGFDAVAAMLRASKRRCTERLAQVVAPSLVIMGERDPDFPNPRAEAEWVAERLGGQWAVIPAAGHYPHAEVPETVGPLMADFIANLLARHAA